MVSRPTATILVFALTACSQGGGGGGGSAGEDTELLSIVGANELIDVQRYLRALGNDPAQAALYNAAFNAVGWVHFSGGTCTGWFISDKYFVTNQHCVQVDKALRPVEGIDQYTAGVCASLSIQLDWETNYNVRASYANYAEPTSGEFRCKQIHLANQAHDVALVEIDGTVPVAPLQLASAAGAGQNVIVVGHPAGEKKKISFRNDRYRCVLSDPSYPPGKTGTDAPNQRYGQKYPHSIVHDCDTKGGSSGSPIMDVNDGLKVVGLHWDGWASDKWPYYDANGKTDQKSSENNDLPYKEGNVGIKIQDIRALVQQHAAALPADLVQLFQ